jgi:phenylalanyl-tRNA synthetase beta chain
MKVPISWLKDYVDIKISIEELKDKLFSCGFEVEDIIYTGKDIENVVVARVISIKKHPNADKLLICILDAGKGREKLQIVTGAHNFKIGDLVPVAVDGAKLANGKTIKNGELRGIKSFGMMCSGEELGLTEDMYEGASVYGILILNEEYKTGTDIKEAVGLNDYIFDINVTANRSDCQSIFGIAREVAAVTKTKIKSPKTDYAIDKLKTTDRVSIKVEDNELCPRYIGHYIKDIKIENSPRWLKKRLSSVGIRSINNIVDITNFVLIELGQPMHAFDLDTIEDSQIIIRCAKDGEKITTLDEKEFKLDNTNLVICDGKKPVAIAGIMGGINSGIKNTTNEVLFESAKFKRDNIRRTSRNLGQRSDSSSRFEKGIDAYTNEFAMNRALNLVSELKCGKISSDRYDICNENLENRIIKTTIPKINNLLGITIPAEQIKNILISLNFDAEIDGDRIIVSVPKFRDDIENYPDLAEEVIRMYGYDNIKSTFLKNASITNGGRNIEQKNIEKLKNIMLSNGLNETVTYSFVSPKDIIKLRFNENDKELKLIKLINPLGEELSVMRTTLIPSMLNVLSKNINRKNLFGRYFELANIYIPEKLPLTELPIENRILSMAIYGEKENFYTLKGIIECIANDFMLEFNYVKCLKPYLHSGRSAEIFCKNKLIGYLGQINPEVAESFDIVKDIYVSEINIEVLSEMLFEKIQYKNIAKYPSIDRDLAIVTEEKTSWDDIVKIVKTSGSEFLKEIKLFDIYRGDKIENGKKSMAFSMKFTALDRTLSIEEIDLITTNILKALDEKLNIKLRA